MKDTATHIVHRLREAGHIAYFAGGCVRDRLRGVEPHDYDIATDATPEQVQRRFAHTVPVGVSFGVVRVIENGHSFEVATFRSEEAYVDGRHPTGVRYGTPEKDAQRRDFTINGLFYDPVTDQILDYVDGRRDIERQVVRTIGDARQRFSEDKLRLLRCVRFAANLGFAIDPATWAAAQEMAGQIAVVSVERIRDELIKIFTRPHAGRGLELLEASGLLREVLPEVAAMKSVEQPPEFHPEGDVFTHTRLMLEEMGAADLSLALAVLLHDVGKPPTFERTTDRVRFNEHDRVSAEMTLPILRRLRFPNDVIDWVVLCVGEHMRIRNVQEMRPAKLKRILARETFPVELELHRLDCVASHGHLDNYEFLKTKAAELPPETLRPAALLCGHDLLAMGYEEGPFLGRMLREIEEMQLDDRFHSREEALAFARARLANGNQLH